MNTNNSSKIPSIYDLPLPVGSMNLFSQESDANFLSQLPKDLKDDKLKGVWAPHEDELLRTAVTEHSQPFQWEEISKFVPGRTPKQCRERWLFRLCPDVDKSPFQRWEDELIVIERARIGNHWTAIAAKLPGRTSCAIKNRWYTVLKNRVYPQASIHCTAHLSKKTSFMPQISQQYV
ncbi:Myb-like DNA-binding domain containing protein [Trichomonas vaginalis G3]|uniref:Myb-like DNA-binding domain containing protein n=1 Tax=Trichomonas vaginalis (strain ATCC PRA-98 / G3) TaxID=412133 RepID=A2EE94_TRIV3|nr:Myb-like DNA-binding domain containing protein [Trichomonas vaginalis G3]|eukprot:XP_001321215.1 Myb-like DNA-binding domain containing protein [Trichomonas vaginalis G3]